MPWPQVYDPFGNALARNPRGWFLLCCTSIPGFEFSWSMVGGRGSGHHLARLPDALYEVLATETYLAFSR